MLMRYSDFKVLLTFQICFTSRNSKYLKPDFLSSLWDGHPQLLGSLTKLKIKISRNHDRLETGKFHLAKLNHMRWQKAA